MFYILDGREHFYQWDMDRKLVVEDKTINKVYFCNRTKNCSLSKCVYEVNGTRLVDVPNSILQDSFRLYVYGYDSNYTKYDASFDIKARSKPEDYILTEEEVKAWEDLEQRITDIEENGVSDDVVAAAVKDYLVENPVEAGATAAQAAQIDANAAAIEELERTAATKAYVDEAVANIGGGSVDVDLSDYYTKAQTDAAIAAAKPDLSGYALKSDIPNLSGYALKSDIPDVSGYQTAEQVNAAIVAYVGVIENGTY